MRHWLRTYKMVDGKGENMLAYNGIVGVTVRCHQEWEKLIKGESEKGELSLEKRNVA